MSASGRRAREKAQRRQEILEAARQVFFRHGFRSPTMDDVAAQAEISKGTIYLYFASKEAVLAHLLLDGLDVLLDNFDAAADEVSDLTPEAALRRIAQVYLDFCQSHPHDFRLQMAFDGGRFEEAIPADLYREIVDKSMHGLNVAVEAIERGRLAGVFHVQDARQAAGVFWAALNGVLVLMGHPLRRRLVGSDAQAMFQATLDQLMRGLTSERVLEKQEVNS